LTAYERSLGRYSVTESWIIIKWEKSPTNGETEIYKYQLLLTNPRDVRHHCKRAANKGGRTVW